MRYDESRRAAVLGVERRAVVFVRDEGLTVDDIRQAEIRRVATVGVGGRESCPRLELDGLEERIDAHAAPAWIELRPLRNARDVDRELLGGQRSKPHRGQRASQ